MNIQEQIEWLALQAETPEYRTASERQIYSDCGKTMKRLNAVYEAAQRIIRESRTQENGSEQIDVEPWVALGNALAAVQTGE